MILEVVKKMNNKLSKFNLTSKLHFKTFTISTIAIILGKKNIDAYQMRREVNIHLPNGVISRARSLLVQLLCRPCCLVSPEHQGMCLCSLPWPWLSQETA